MVAQVFNLWLAQDMILSYRYRPRCGAGQRPAPDSAENGHSGAIR
jgi:hypothetical protein